MNQNNNLPFNSNNYRWMIIGLVVLIVGFIVMSLDNKPHGFGILGLTIGPVIIMAGFVIEIYAILVNRHTKEEPADTKDQPSRYKK